MEHDVLTGKSESAWLTQVRALVLRADLATAEAAAIRALAEHPRSLELRRALAGIYVQLRRNAQAEAMLRELLAQQPDDAAAAFTLTRLLKDEGRMSAAGAVMRACFEHGRHDSEMAIAAIELLDDCGRKQDAAAIAEMAIKAAPGDPRLYTYAGMLLHQLGEFDLARQRHSFALAHSAQALDWNVPLGLAGLQRYRNADHPDFALFRESLQRADVSERARVSLLFALAKAHDDIGDYAQAAQYLRQGNAHAHAAKPWSRADWQRGVDARLALAPASLELSPPPDWTPLFIVGMPRSGTTLLAELLARDADICNRGELAWLPFLAKNLPPANADSREAYLRAAATYRAHLCQDDSAAPWFIDKQPHNFQHVDTILALFPNARIIYCQRNARDNALSLYSQLFIADTQDFSYDFEDIATVMRDCTRLMAHWQTRYPQSIRRVQYEQLAADPAGGIAALRQWLGLSEFVPTETAGRTAAISTASLWQARQPVYTRSVGRWRNYATLLPELLNFPDA